MARHITILLSIQ